MQPCVLASVCSSMCLELAHTQVCQNCVAKQAHDLHALSMQKCSNAFEICHSACIVKLLPCAGVALIHFHPLIAFKIIRPWNLPNNSVDAIITKFDHFLTINHLLLCIWANRLCIDDIGTTIVMEQIYLVHIKQLKRVIWKLVCIGRRVIVASPRSK